MSQSQRKRAATGPAQYFMGTRENAHSQARRHRG